MRARVGGARRRDFFGTQKKPNNYYTRTVSCVNNGEYVSSYRNARALFWRDYRPRRMAVLHFRCRRRISRMQLDSSETLIELLPTKNGSNRLRNLSKRVLDDSWYFIVRDRKDTKNDFLRFFLSVDFFLDPTGPYWTLWSQCDEHVRYIQKPQFQ